MHVSRKQHRHRPPPCCVFRADPVIAACTSSTPRHAGPDPRALAPRASHRRRTSSQSLLPWPSHRDLRLCGLVSFGAHSCSGGPQTLARAPLPLSFSDGGAFDFPVAAMRDEITMARLTHHCTADAAAPPTSPAAAFLACCQHVLQRILPTRAQPTGATPCGRANSALRLCMLQPVFSYDSYGSGSLPDSPAHGHALSRHSAQLDRDFHLESLAHSDLLHSNVSVPFGRGGDPAGLHSLLASEGGEPRSDSLPTVPSMGAVQEGGAPGPPPAGALRAMVLLAASFGQRFRSFGRRPAASRAPGMRTSSDWYKSASGRWRSALALQHGLWPFGRGCGLLAAAEGTV